MLALEKNASIEFDLVTPLRVHILCWLDVSLGICGGLNTMFPIGSDIWIFAPPVIYCILVGLRGMTFIEGSGI